MIYFLQLERTPYIKIGYTQNLDNRIRKLQSDNPLRIQVLGTCDGDRLEESFYHSIFKNEHVHGDWFRNSAKLRKFLKQKFGKRIDSRAGQH